MKLKNKNKIRKLKACTSTVLMNIFPTARYLTRFIKLFLNTRGQYINSLNIKGPTNLEDKSNFQIVLYLKNFMIFINNKDVTVVYKFIMQLKCLL